MATLPHSGEQIPPEAQWLKTLDETTLMGDVDRYVDRLYEGALTKLGIPFVKTEWHRYAADLNRLPTDVDAEAVSGNVNPAGTFPRGFHWVYNTHGEKILHQPLTLAQHEALVKRVYAPFHEEVQLLAGRLLQTGDVYHLDLHSMPSVGTVQHRDPGERRKDVVISDVKGTSCSAAFKDIVIDAFTKEGFSVSHNWPYFGGRLTEQYGHPTKGHHALQVELNRALYMNEQTKQINFDWQPLSERLYRVMKRIQDAAACEFGRV
jgi:N-formylglutamate amidohydrolase